MKKEIALPAEVVRLWKASEALRKRYKETDLAFTLDGKLVGDIGEAVAARAFDLELLGKRKPVDARAPDGRSVQIKATGRENRGPAFSPGESSAQHLIFLRIDFPKGVVHIIYNGPEAPVRRRLRSNRRGTQTVPLDQVIKANAVIPESRRLDIVTQR